MDQPTILIVSDEAAFPRLLKSRWQNEARVPAFILMGSDLCRDIDLNGFTAAVVGQVRPDVLPLVLHALSAAAKPVLLVCEDDAQAQSFRHARSHLRLLVQEEGWPNIVVMVVAEIILRQEAGDRVEELRRANALLERQSTLGGYVLEMRHSLNNALTSILGNAELMLLDADPRNSASRAQIETIRGMALRIHEALARFTSLDKELSALERPLETVSPKSRTGSLGTIQ